MAAKSHTLILNWNAQLVPLLRQMAVARSERGSFAGGWAGGRARVRAGGRTGACFCALQGLHAWMNSRESSRRASLHGKGEF